tara:strand:+ start:637 stop:1311 length:675 start_codon:yes stop_codon:yes gene_type:complete
MILKEDQKRFKNKFFIMNAFGEKDYIDVIFPRNFMGVMTPPNLEELLVGFDNDDIIRKDQDCHWNYDCLVQVDFIDVKKAQHLLAPTIFKFFEKYFKPRGISNLNFTIQDLWKNTYKRGYHQEVHNHWPADLSCVVFLDDPKPDSAKFYFYDRFNVEISDNWKKLSYESSKQTSSIPTYGPDKREVILSKGTFLFFPSNVPHGVSAHNDDDIRRTVSFNINFSL